MRNKLADIRTKALSASALAALFLADPCAASADGWHHKAVSSVADAAGIAGMTDDDRALYSRGVQHIANAHGQLGRFTIGQVVDDERDREDAAMDSKSTAYLSSKLRLGNADIGFAFFHGGAINKTFCVVRIDQTEYDNGGEQTQSLVKQTVAKACAAAYEHGGRSASGHVVRVINLADDEVFNEGL